jgi:hypothetical protein
MESISRVSMAISSPWAQSYSRTPISARTAVEITREGYEVVVAGEVSVLSRTVQGEPHGK